MKALRRIALMATVASSAIIADAAAFAQDTSSNLRGTVMSPAGQPVGDVAVTIIHAPTGTSRTVIVDESGRFSARGLPVGGPYIVKVAGDDEITSNVVSDLMLQLGTTGSVQLIAGQAADVEEILVTGSSNVLADLKTGASRNFGQTAIEGIPSIARDFVSVLETDSKILVDDSVPRGPAVSIAGQNFRFNSVTIDGVAQNDNFGLSLNASATQRTPISIDAIGAINVNVAPFDVTYGNFLGGNVNIVTKSGTNEFHGTAYAFYTDDGLTGDTSKGEDLAIGEYNERTYGATLGGPIIKDKLFFFANYEIFRTTRPANTQTIDNIEGVTQAQVDQVVDIFQSEYGFDPGQFAVSDNDVDEKILIKLDWNINDNHRAVGSFQRADGDVLFDDFPELAVLNSNRYNINESMNSYSFHVFSDWSDNFSTEFKLGFKDVTNRQVSIDSSTPDFLIHTAEGGQITAGGDRFRHNNLLDNSSRIFKLKADYVYGDHTFTAGVEQEHNSIYNIFIPFTRGQVIFNSIDDFANRNIGSVLIGGPNGAFDDAIADFSIDTNTIYVQDEWLVSDKLTLKFGVRYDWMNNSDEIPLNDDFVARNGFANTENLDGKSMFLPRLGFNYQHNDRLTIRGGAGLFGGGTPLIMLSNSYGGNGVTRTFASFFAPFFGGPFPDLINQVADNLPNEDAVSDVFGGFIGVNPDADVDALSPDIELLSSWKYNLAVDYVADLSSLGMGDDWNITLEAIVTRVKNGYDIYEGRREAIGTAPDGRPIYNNTDSCGTFFNCADYIVRNTSEGGSEIFSLDIAKDFDTDFGYISTTFGYTYQNVEDTRSYNRFVGFETYAFDPQRDLNDPDLATSRFEIPHRITATVNWEKNIFADDLKTQIGLTYAGRSGRNFSYVFNGDALTFGGNFLADAASPDNPGPNLFYVPTGIDDPLVTGDAAFLGELDSLISGDSCLNENRGGIIGRNSCRTGWVSHLNFRFLQEVRGWGDHKIDLILDIENLGNMINSDWGRLDAIFQPSNVPLADVTIADGQYVYSPSSSSTATAARPNVARIPSAYKIQLGVRYKF